MRIPTTVLYTTMLATTAVVNADDRQAAIAACTEAASIEQADPKYRGQDLTFVCPDTPHTAETWRCVVLSMQDHGYSLSQAMTHCGIAP